MSITRRSTLAGLTAAPLFASTAKAHSVWDTIVIGAGVFGAWTAEYLRRSGQQVLLVDAWGASNARASSGGESRMTRGGYGADSDYTQMAQASLEEWKRLSVDTDLPLFHNIGVLAFFDKDNDYARESLSTMTALELPIDRIEVSTLKTRWPQINWSGVEFGLLEPSFGALMARRGVATLVQKYIASGGAYKHAAVIPPKPGTSLTNLKTYSGEDLSAKSYVFACGPWLAKMFPDVLGSRLFTTKQDIFYFRPKSGDSRYKAPAMPGWAHFRDGNIMYGFPDLESRGFKIADDSHGVIVDPDKNDRLPNAGSLALVRAYMEERFPGLEGAPLSEVRVCQYGNSANGDFLIDHHPDHDNVVLVGMGSGHGFKHGPAVGKHAAELLRNGTDPGARFSLSTKATQQKRAVH